MDMEIMVRLTVEVEPHRYRPTRDEVAKQVLEDGVRFYLVGQADGHEVEPAPSQYEPDDWRGYFWTVTGATIGEGTTPTARCAQCGQPVDLRPGSGRQREYCSSACRQKAYRDRGGE
jgi:hypothetical protein